jgi:hypothetical protein
VANCYFAVAGRSESKTEAGVCSVRNSAVSAAETRIEVELGNPIWPADRGGATQTHRQVIKVCLCWDKANDLDNVHLAYWTLNGPQYARINGVDARAPVLSERIDDKSGAGMYVSLDVVRNGATLETQVAYYDSRAAEPGAPAGRLKLAVRRCGTWLPPDTVDGQGDVGGFASLKSDAGGRALVAYYDFDRGRIRIATSEPV